jgi:hypothetical protein
MNLVVTQTSRPTEAQASAGNYKKAHIRLHGLAISIENPKGSIRSGVNSFTGERWQRRMTAHYGYIRGYQGADKDQLDVFIGPEPESQRVYIVNQIVPETGAFDEHKAILGCGNLEDAKALYLSNYQKGWKGIGNIKALSIDEFKDWLEEGDLKHAKKAFQQKLSGGLADKRDPKDFDRAKLEAGIRVELEHTDDRELATEIAMDHLTEQQDYYEKLKQVEKSSFMLQAENETIRRNKNKPQAKERHRFKPAQWTHANGHPRCIICGDEPSDTGYCNDSAKKSQAGWIGVDLDGTLAYYNGDHETIGPPIPAMLARVKAWLAEGREVRIFTARAIDPRAKRDIQDWCLEYIGAPLAVTNKKDPAMIELWDDRAVQVEKNTGDPVSTGGGIVAAIVLKSVGVSRREEDTWKGITLVVAPTVIKAIIKTPTVPGGGRIDWDAVPVGASIWITVTDPESPMHGRHILITKRPDGQAVIDPGEARRHGYKMGSWADEAASDTSGMAHASFQMGKLHEQRKDVERWQAYEERKKEREPFEQKLREVRGQANARAREVESGFLQSVGISKHGLTKVEKDIVAQSASKQAEDAGMEPELALAYGKALARVRDQIERRFQKDAALRRYKVYEKALEHFQAELFPKGEEQAVEQEGVTLPTAALVDDEQPAQDQEAQREADLQALAQLAARESEPLEVEAPQIPLDATTPQEVENAIIEDFTKKAAEAMKRRQENEELREEAKRDAVLIRATQEAEDPLARLLYTRDREAAEQAVKAFGELQKARAEAGEIKQIMPPKLPRPETAVVATAIEQLRLKAVEAVTEEKIAEAEKRYRDAAQMDLNESFYAVVSEHWNDETGYAINGGVQDGASEFLNGMLKRKKGFVSGAAAAALTGLVGKHTGIELDVGRLAHAFSPDVAAAVVGHWLVNQARTRQLKGKSISAIIDAIEQDNKANLLQMEKKALETDAKLKDSYEKIQKQKNNGELSAEATIMRMEAQNILQRRENIGRAFGSLSASGSLLAAMKHAQAGIDDRLSVNVGSSRENAERILKEELGINPNKLPPEIKITHKIIGSEGGEPLPQYQISANASYFAQRWGRNAPIVNKETQELNKVKTDNSPVTSLDNPPHFRTEWINDAGEKVPFLYRQGQRNDVNWLRKVGGGLITRTTGAGKTLTSAGFISHLLKENPNSKHLALVPDGLTAQWADQLSRATTIPFIVIPEKQTKEERAKFWAQVKPGMMVIASHSDALKSQSDVDAIIGHGFHSATIDEPQNLKSQQSEKMGTAARRIVNLPFKHRVGLSASPARESMDEIYEWLNWSTKEHVGEDKRGRPMFRSKIGSKVGFGRMYAGAGAGTNAQDEALQSMVYQKFSPFLSGDEFKTRPNYKVVNNDYTAKRTPAQIEKQKTIEAGYEALKDKITTEETAKAKRMGKNKLYVQQRVAQRLQKEMEQAHWKNLHGGEDNGKTRSVVDKIKAHIKEGRNQHIVFVDNDTHRASIAMALRKQGIKAQYDLTELNKRAKFKEDAEKLAKEHGITQEQAIERVVAKRKEEWASHKQKGEPSVIFIDKTSQAGHNLQTGDSIQIAGRPVDAAGLYQSIGRGDRSPREGDFHIDTHRYSDSPFEDAHWTDIDNQRKVVLSITPALAKSAHIGLLIKGIKSRILNYFGL